MTKSQSRRQRSRAACAVVGIVAAWCLLAVPASANDAPSAGYPSWADVEKTKGDAAATAAQVEEISKLLTTLDSKSGELGDAAVQAGADFAIAQEKLDSVNAEIVLLEARSQRAAEQAQLHKANAVAVAVQNYKHGGANFGVFATIADLESSNSLNSMDLLQKMGERSAAKQVAAVESQAVSEHLKAAREGAQEVLAELTRQAAAAKDTAVTAQSLLKQQIFDQQSNSDALMAQLAFLKDTSVAQEREYRQGQNALLAYQQVQAAKQQAALQLQRELAAGKDASGSGSASNAGAATRPTPAPKPPPDPVPVPKPVPNPAPTPDPLPVPKPKPPVAETPGGSGTLTPNVPGGAVNDPAGAKAYAAAALGSFGWGQDQFQCLNMLWERESNWRTNATNPHSGAYGIAQALAAHKYSKAGSDWLTNYRTQVNWGLGYIKGRYGSPCGAWDHSQSVGWY